MQILIKHAMKILLQKTKTSSNPPNGMNVYTVNGYMNGLHIQYITSCLNISIHMPYICQLPKQRNDIVLFAS